jgi:putative inorganic carbon (hco3(-)) transporter
VLQQPRAQELIAFGAAGALAGVVLIELAYRIGPFSPLVAVGGLCIAWLAVTRPILAVYSAIVLVPLEVTPLPLGKVATLSPTEAAFIVAGLGWAVRRLLSGRLPYVRTPLGAPLVLLVLAVLASYSSAPAALPVTKIVVMWSMLLLVYWLIADEGTPGSVRGILIALGIAGAVVGMIALVNSGGVEQQLSNAGETARGRAIGSFTQPNILAAFLALSLPGTIVLAIYGRGWIQPAMAAALVPICAGMALSLSRGGLLAAAGAVAVLVSWRPFRRLAIAFALVFILLAAVNANPLGSVQQVDTVTQRVESVQYAPRIDPRITIWTTTPHIVEDHPWFGVGAGSFAEVATTYGLTDPGTALPFDHAHNVPLTIAAELGLFGLAAFVWLVVQLTRVVIRALRRTHGDERALAVAVTAALVGLALQGAVDYTQRSNVLAGLMICLFASAVILSRVGDTPPVRPPDRPPSSPPT